MGSSIAVDRANFAVDVLERSHAQPVLVDFFAQWCGPCQLLKPLLEKLAQEYDFVLAKVDIDQSPELAQTYNVQGVPDVRIVIEGEVTEGFVGVLPEPQLRELMAQLNLKSEVEATLEKIYDEGAIGNLETAQTLLAELLQRHPDNYQLALEAANFYLETNHLETVESLLARIPNTAKEYTHHANRLRSLLTFKQVTAEPLTEVELDNRFRHAAADVLAEHYQPALDTLLDILRQDRKYRQDGARKAMLHLFTWLGDDHPLTKEYRKKLVSALY